jgi:hypothetical protein
LLIFWGKNEFFLFQKKKKKKTTPNYDKNIIHNIILDILFQVWAFGWAVVVPAVDQCSQPNKAEGSSSIKVSNFTEDITCLLHKAFFLGSHPERRKLFQRPSSVFGLLE